MPDRKVASKYVQMIIDISSRLTFYFFTFQKLAERKATLTKMMFSKDEDRVMWEMCPMISSEESGTDDGDEVCLFVLSHGDLLTWTPSSPL